MSGEIVGPPSKGEIRFATLIAKSLHDQGFAGLDEWMKGLTVRTSDEVNFSVSGLPITLIEGPKYADRATVLLIFDKNFFESVSDAGWINDFVRNLQGKRLAFERLGLSLEPMEEGTISRVLSAFRQLSENKN